MRSIDGSNGYAVSGFCPNNEQGHLLAAVHRVGGPDLWPLRVFNPTRGKFKLDLSEAIKPYRPRYTLLQMGDHSCLTGIFSMRPRGNSDELGLHKMAKLPEVKTAIHHVAINPHEISYCPSDPGKIDETKVCRNRLQQALEFHDLDLPRAIRLSERLTACCKTFTTDQVGALPTEDIRVTGRNQCIYAQSVLQEVLIVRSAIMYATPRTFLVQPKDQNLGFERLICYHLDINPVYAPEIGQAISDVGKECNANFQAFLGKNRDWLIHNIGAGVWHEPGVINPLRVAAASFITGHWFLFYHNNLPLELIPIPARLLRHCTICIPLCMNGHHFTALGRPKLLRETLTITNQQYIVVTRAQTF